MYCNSPVAGYHAAENTWKAKLLAVPETEAYSSSSLTLRLTTVRRMRVMNSRV